MKSTLELLGDGYVYEAKAASGSMVYTLTEAQLEALVRRARADEWHELTSAIVVLPMVAVMGPDAFMALRRDQVIGVLTSRTAALTAQPDGTEKGPNR